RVSLGSHHLELTARRNTECHQCFLARPARSDGRVFSIRASQTIFQITQFRAAALRSLSLSPPSAQRLCFPIATPFDRQTLPLRHVRHQRCHLSSSLLAVP